MVEARLVLSSVLYIPRFFLLFLCVIFLLFLKVDLDLFELRSNHFDITASFLQLSLLHQIEGEEIPHHILAHLEFSGDIEIWQKGDHDNQVNDEIVVDQRAVVDQITHLRNVDNSQYSNDELNDATDDIKDPAY